ncbi:helix-turn-helix domain-containing protein [Chromobacterium piscinae]|uniref:Helix-turn-helix domain-containing protein n=3 Tax=Chromobacterium piscinae TaxID=686831 RepID=A0ABV0H3Q7_9NEIS|nr:helix-turn-helix domain-containing protein [Chromobacterium vaccinii]MBX9355106.1 helix-turn-helix domain-containing protein [Chromobacterium vaccinii]
MNACIDLLCLPNCLSGTLFSAIDVLHAANKLWHLHHPRRKTPPFSWRLLDSDGAEQPLPAWLPASPARPAAARCALLVPGLDMDSVPQLKQQLDRADKALRLIALRHAAGDVIATNYNGAALLARAGILDGRNATITWLIAGWFSSSHPRVKLLMDRPVTQDGGVFCSGAPAAATELVLELVRHFAGDELAQRCTNGLLYLPARFEQSAQTLSALSTPTRDSVVFKARRWLEQHVAEPYSLGRVAAAAAVSSRTLLRHFREVADMTPLDYLQQLRVERAKLLLEVTMLDLPGIVEQCGYDDPCAFRRLFRRQTGLTPAAYRRAYALRASRRRWRADDAMPQPEIGQPSQVRA